ncbi:MAG TPA: HutD family protein [Xanthomonadaceae bacterium]|jgi:environmental stress-induced protein Ves|nr:HutD family protein [Xanthomonadaceae bacterium]
MPLLPIPANEYRRVRWRNGQGWTREIATGVMATPAERQASEGPQADLRSPAGASAQVAWDWRLSIAEIEQNGPFSEFAGCDRVLVLLSGQGMNLDFADGTRAELAPPHGRIAFASEQGVQCALVDGPTTDFNAIVRRDHCSMQVYHRPLVGSMVFFAEAGVLWAIHLMAGRATVKSGDESAGLNAGDTVLFDNGGGDASVRSILDGGGDALLVRIQRVVPSDA